MPIEPIDRFDRRTVLRTVGGFGLTVPVSENSLAAENDTAADGDVEYTLTVFDGDGTEVGSVTVTDPADLDEYGNRIEFGNLGDYFGDGDHGIVDHLRYGNGEIIESWENRDLSDYSMTNSSSGDASIVSNPTAHGERAVQLNTGQTTQKYTSADDLVVIDTDTVIEGEIRHQTDNSYSFAMKTSFGVGFDENGDGGITVQLINPGYYRTSGARISTPNGEGRIRFTPALGEFYTFRIELDGSSKEPLVERTNPETVTLENDSSLLEVGAHGSRSWVVDGTETLFEEFFVLEDGNGNRVASYELDDDDVTVTKAAQTVYDANVDATIGGTDVTINRRVALDPCGSTFEVDYEVLKEDDTATIPDLTLYQYGDFDRGGCCADRGVIVDDVASVSDATGEELTVGYTGVRATGANGDASADGHEAGQALNTREQLEEGTVDLDDTDAFPASEGDAGDPAIVQAWDLGTLDYDRNYNASGDRRTGLTVRFAAAGSRDDVSGKLDVSVSTVDDVVRVLNVDLPPTAVETDEAVSFTAEVYPGCLDADDFGGSLTADVTRRGDQVADPIEIDLAENVTEITGTEPEAVRISASIGSAEEIVSAAPTEGVGFTVDVEVTALGEPIDALQFSGSYTSKDRIRTFAFGTLESVGTVYAKFADSTVGGTDGIDPIHAYGDLEERQREVAADVNEYMAGWKGSFGVVGFEFDFFDNGGEWYTVESATFYDSLGDDADSEFRGDALEAIADAEDEYDDVDDFTGGYDSTISVSPGDASNYSLNTLSDDHRTGLASRQTDRVFVNEGHPRFGTWVHELGHTYGHRDLYEYDQNEPTTHGQVGFTGIMGSGTRIYPHAPFSTVSRTTFHNLYPISENQRAEWPWLDIETHRIEYDDDGDIEFTVESLESMEHGDTVPVFDPSIGLGSPTYVFGARGEDMQTTVFRGPENVNALEQGVYLYRVQDHVPNRIDHVANEDFVNTQGGSARRRDATPTFMDDGDSRELSFPSSNDFFEITLVDADGSGDDYTATMEVSLPQVAGQAVVSLEDASFPDLAGQFGVSDAGLADGPDGVVTPDLRLHAYDLEGNHVGLNYDTGEFEFEIPGIDEDDVSWPVGPNRWIAVPADLDLRFEVDARGVETWINWFEETYDVDADDLDPEDLATEVTVRVDRYGEDPQLNEDRDIEDHVTRTRRVSLAPAETSATSASADVAVTPRTLKASANGIWVTAEIRLPHEELDVEEIDLSTVRLNEVGAVDEGYGFTEKPVSGDAFEARFPREEVVEALDPGDDVRVTVTGATESDALFVGDDSLTVIERGNGKGN